MYAGIIADGIALDPGFGFGKTSEENYYILKYLSELCTLGYPLTVGLSRKSMIGQATGGDVAERAAGTLAAEMLAAHSGASIIRTHNVKACADGLKVLAYAGAVKKRKE
jgi:dihydropteroate synthase